MQLIPRYLVNDRINVVSSETGYTVEFRPVYTRQLKIYKGIDNKVQFRLLNADQKPLEVSATPRFVAFDENQTLVLDKDCIITDDGSTRAARGTFEVTISESDLLNIQQQYLHYNIYLENLDGERILTYANRNFDSSGIIYIDGNSFPGPKPPVIVTTFLPEGEVWRAGSAPSSGITAQGGTNSNEGLHSVAVYSTGYIGSVKIQATQDRQLIGLGNNWFDVMEIVFDGNETEPVIVSFTGIYTYFRFELDADPNNTIEKILIRN